jgi:Tol biopolymer transport system component
MMDDTMMRNAKEPGLKAAPASPENEQPLESWKEIAAYLKRDTRTVRRWEKSEKLPVRRHHHLSRASVYAYPSELDAWKQNRNPAAEPGGIFFRWPVRLPAFAITLLLALVTAGGGLIHPQATAADGPAIVVKRIWPNPIDDLGAPSPDGRLLSFVDWSTGDLAIRDLTTGENKRVTKKGSWSDSSEYAEFSIFSPDGMRLAYAWFNQKTNNYELRVIGRDGAAMRVLHAHPETFYVQPVAWTPDGKHLLAVFSKQDRTNQIVTVNDADGAVRVIRSFDWRYPQPRLSPDGRWIAYDFPPNEAASQRDIYLLAADGAREVPLVESPAHDFLLGWSPDGSQIIFASDRTGSEAAWLQPIAAGRPEGNPALIRQQVGRVRALGVTPSGALFYRVPGLRDVHVGEFDPRAGRVVSEPRNVTDRIQGANLNPAWSPDGKLLAFMSTRGPQRSTLGATAIVIRSMDNGEERELFPQISLVANPNRRVFAWAPDGKSLLVAARDQKGRQGVYSVDAQTGEAKLVYQPDPRLESRDFYVMPDGKSLLMVRGAITVQPAYVVVVDLASNRERKVFSASHIHSADVSPDGQFVALAMVTEEDARASRIPEPNANRLVIAPIDGGEAREILHVPPEQEVTAVVWTADQKHLLINIRVGPSEAPLPESNQVWRIAAEGGKPEPVNLTLPPDRLRNLRFHPSGRKFALTVGSGSNEIWMMENFLPVQKAAK